MHATSDAMSSGGLELRAGLLVFPDEGGVAREAAARFARCVHESVAERGRFCVALAGGRTPRGLYRLLATDEFRSQLDWSRVHLFWGDERPVPPDHPDSNYAMARRELLDHVSLPDENIHRMPAEQQDLGRAASEYEEVLRAHIAFGAHGLPRFDLVLLGLGADGHTASLFPGSGPLGGTERWVIAPFVGKLGSRRMTLTLPVLNAARNVFFLVTGSGKAEALRRVVESGAEPPLPAQRVRPADGDCIFLVDASAASRLRREPS